nr:hypothetical protein [Tanacetum cinerariifolium]
ALYTKSCGCSRADFEDKFVHDPNKKPDSSQRPPHDCLKCGNPVDDFLNTSESSDDNSNAVNAPQDPFVFSQDPGENSSQSPPHIDHHCCYGCGDSLDGPHETFQCQPMNYYEPNTCYDSSSFEKFQPSQSVIDHLNLQQRINDSMIKLRGTFQAWLQQQKYQVVNLDSYSPKPLQCQKIPIYYDDDDDEESSTSLRDIIIYELPLCIAITPVLSTKEPNDSLIMRDEHLDTILEKESDEFINDDKSFSDEDVLKEIYSNPLFDEEIISIKIDPQEFNSKNSDAIIESFSPSPIPVKDSDPFIEEIDLFLTSDGSIPPCIDSD